MKRILPNPFYKASITLLLKPDKPTTRKQNYKPTVLLNMNAKIFNKILGNQVQQHTESINTITNWDLGLGSRWFNIGKPINVLLQVNWNLYTVGPQVTLEIHSYGTM